MSAYYNEHDKFAAAWLRELIKAGLIADGDVDERSIEDVTPDDVRGYTQAHFFAGIGGWSYALRLAGWPDDRPVWTGSCPCQSYSQAGRREGAADARNLWPAWFRLIQERKPLAVFGEQVEGAIQHGWLDDVSTSLEAEDYAVGACVLGAHSVGRPHIRQRLYWMAHRNHEGSFLGSRDGESTQGVEQPSRCDPTGCRETVVLADASSERRQQESRGASSDESTVERRAEMVDYLFAGNGEDGRMADAATQGWRIGRTGEDGDQSHATFWREGERESQRLRVDDGWLWLECADGTRRPTKPGLQPVAHGIRGRMDLLRGAGNAIVPQVAAAFIEAYLDAEAESLTA